MLNRLCILLLIYSAMLFQACTVPACIDCTQHSGDLPKTLICQDTYEALPETPKLSWSEFSNRAIEQGCEPANR